MKVFIIAEVGINHNGSINLAKKLINVASKAGADAVKFQTFKTENVVVNAKANYQKNDNEKNQSQFELIKKLDLCLLKNLLIIVKKDIVFIKSL